MNNPGQLPAQAGDGTAPEFIDTGFENAFPLWYDVVDGVVRIHLTTTSSV